MPPAKSDKPRDPLIALRIPPALNKRLRAESEHTGSSISEIVRAAIEQRLVTPNGNAPAAPAPTRKKSKRDGLLQPCEHRVRPGAFCRKCDRIV